MATTPASGLPYPTTAYAPNIPSDLQALATSLDQKVVTQVATSTARTALASKYDGQLVYEQSSQRLFRWYAGGSRWEFVTGPWYTWTPTLVGNGGSAVTATTITIRAVYTIMMGRLYFSASMQFSGGINGQAGALSMTMPSGAVSSSALPQASIGAQLVATANNSRWVGGGIIGASATNVQPVFPVSTSNCSSASFTNATSVGATGTGVPQIPSSYPLADGSYLWVWGDYELSSWAAL